MSDTDATRPDPAAHHPASGSRTQQAAGHAGHGDHGGDSPTRAAVLAALTARPGTTVVDLAEDGGLGRSTVAKALAALEADGLATRTAGGRRDGRRLPDTWAPTESAAEPRGDGGNARDHTDDDHRAGDPDDHRGGSGDDATDTGSGDASAASADTDDADTSLAPAADGDDDDGHRRQAASPAPATGARLAPGQLRDKVAAHLRAHSDAELTPYQISRALGGSSAGAVANALDKLVNVGAAELVSEKPRRYRALNR